MFCERERERERGRRERDAERGRGREGGRIRDCSHLSGRPRSDRGGIGRLGWKLQPGRAKPPKEGSGPELELHPNDLHLPGCEIFWPALHGMQTQRLRG